MAKVVRAVGTVEKQVCEKEHYFYVALQTTDGVEAYLVPMGPVQGIDRITVIR